jgi:serine/threonine-protein kinase
VVHRQDGGGPSRGREPFLQRWLFSPRLVIVVLVLALGVGLGLGGWWLMAGRYAPVPSLAGATVAQATAALTADGFTVRNQTKVHSNTVAKGRLVATSPTGRVSKGSAITLLVSDGPFTSTVPRVAGLQLSAAQAALQRVHLDSITEKAGSTAPVGTVIGTRPPAGTSWPQTKPVTILVSAGLTLPNFIGMTFDSAQQWASQHGVTLQQQQDTNSQQPAGTITGQQPAGGTAVQQGETVTVNVSAGPQEVPIPSPIGMTVGQATKVLQAAGFGVQVNRFGPGDRVWDYSPVVQAPRGSTITLVVGL